MKNRVNNIIAFYNNYGFNINLAVLFCILISSILFLNRSFVIGSSIAISFILFIYKRIRFKKPYIFLLLLSTSFIIGFLAFLIKSDSSLGRIFIYKVSWQMFGKNYLTGIGLGNFKVKYGLYQANYFEQGNFTQKEFLLADNVFYAYNDYWQFIIETGVVGLGLLLIGLIFLTKLIKKRLEGHCSDNLLRLTIALLLVICVAALFTHVFEKEIFQLFFVVTVTWLIVKGANLKRGFKRLILFCTFGSCLFYLHFDQLVNFKAYYRYDEAKLLSTTGYLNESQKIYKELYPVLKNDVSFLRSYMDEITSADTALRIYLHLINLRTDNRTYLRLGKIYEGLGMYHRAERAYLTSVNMVPNRFAPRLALFNFYIQAQNFNEAKKVGSEMLKMPVKISSNTVTLIRQEILKKMELYKL